MISLNLIDSNDSDMDYELFTFPDGQPHIKLLEVKDKVASDNSRVAITTRITSPTDLFLIMLAVDVLQAKGYNRISLAVSYLMGARMDRRIDNNQPFTLKAVTSFINRLNFDFVWVFDPHSLVSVGLIDRCIPVSNSTFIKHVISRLPGPTLAAPDVGASTKTFDLAMKFGRPMIQCLKHRDMETGKLSHFSVEATDLKGRPILIVDDICDGGGTFLGLAEELKKKNAGDLYLAVSHGIFSKGTDELFKYFKEIFTTDSYQSLPKDSKVTTIPLKELV